MSPTCEILLSLMNDVNPSRRWTQRKDSDRAQRAELTRLSLIGAARRLFTKRGYHAVGIRDITAEAGVTRGALAHHFADKEALFVAVFDQIEQELIAATSEPPHPAREPALGPAQRPAQVSAPDPQPDPQPDLWAHFRHGVQLYLEAATRPDVQRITLIDGPAVLGWRRWRALEEGYSLGSLIAVLQAAMDAGRIRTRPIEPLAHLILGSVMEAALLVAHSDDPAQRRLEVGDALDDLLAGLE